MLPHRAMPRNRGHAMLRAATLACLCILLSSKLVNSGCTGCQLAWCSGYDCTANGSYSCTTCFFFCSTSWYGCTVSCNVDCAGYYAGTPCYGQPSCNTPTIYSVFNFQTTRQRCNGGNGCNYSPPSTMTCSTVCSSTCNAMSASEQFAVTGSCEASCPLYSTTAQGLALVTYWSTMSTQGYSYPSPMPTDLSQYQICGNYTVTAPCIKTCNVDCVMSLASPSVCPQMCINGQNYTSFRIPYTTSISPYAAGKPCPVSPTDVSVVCTTNCAIDCTLDYDLAVATCGSCTGNGCPGNLLSDSGSKTCTYATSVSAQWGGKTCNASSTIVPCTENCCIMKTPTPSTHFICSANCATTTYAFPLYYTPQPIYANSNRRCPTNLIYSLQTCTLTQSLLDLCSGACTVDGFPEDPCLSLCSGSSAPSTKFLASATYPITVHSGTGNCPTFTKECDCSTCIMQSVPTSVDACDASCVANDGNIAMGQKTNYYSPVYSHSGADCTASSVTPCSVTCSCQYTSASAETCLATTTVSTSTPWVGYGNAAVWLFGDNPNCQTVNYVACTTTFTPTACKMAANCPNDCFCWPTLTGMNVKSTLEPCSYALLQSPMYGGPPCETNAAPYSTCITSCPGCSYNAEMINTCSYTTSTMVPNGDMIFFGAQVFTQPALGPPKQYLDRGIHTETWNDPCHGFISVPDPTETCSTVIPSASPQCIYWDAENTACAWTQTISSTLALGYQVVSQTDLRGTDAPQSCTPTTITRSCAETFTRPSCSATSYCLPCNTVCPSGYSGTTSSTQNCYLATLYSPPGAIPCSIASPLPTTCRVTCTGSPTTSSLAASPTTALLSQSQAPIAENKFLNAFFLSDVVAAGSTFGGSVYTCGNLFLASGSVGSDLLPIVFGCEANYPALYAANNLMISGSIYAGVVEAGGLCSDATSMKATCGYQCNRAMLLSAQSNHTDALLLVGNSNPKCYPATLDCAAESQLALARSAALTQMNATASARSVGNGAIAVSWSNNDTEVLYIPNSLFIQNNTVFPAFNSFDDQYYPGSQILINVGGSLVRIEGTSFEYFSRLRNLVTWNFYEAKNIFFTDVTFYGTIYAPQATISGSGTIYGKVYAGGLSTTQGHGLSFKLP